MAATEGGPGPQAGEAGGKPPPSDGRAQAGEAPSQRARDEASGAPQAQAKPAGGNGPQAGTPCGADRCEHTAKAPEPARGQGPGDGPQGPRRGPDGAPEHGPRHAGAGVSPEPGPKGLDYLRAGASAEANR